jgi:hypothetical protein
MPGTEVFPVTVLPVVAVFLIRLGVVLLSVTAIGIALVPILVLIDLLDGGTGWGLCPNGIEACHNPYTTGAEIAILLTLGLFLSVLGIRLLMRLARRLRSDDYQVSQ